MQKASEAIAWLLASDEPWTRHRTLLDLDHRPADDPSTVDARAAMVSHESITTLLDQAANWPGYPLKRHNDAAHPLYALSTLADFGFNRSDPQIDDIAQAVLAHFDGDQFETLLWLPRFLTKEDDTEAWAWMLCDAPTLPYSLLSFGYRGHPLAAQAVEAVLAMAEDNGWRCGAAASLPRFSGHPDPAIAFPDAAFCHSQDIRSAGEPCRHPVSRIPDWYADWYANTDRRSPPRGAAQPP